MRILRASEKKSPRVSLILLDWSVRESFHLLSYLENQTVPQDQFEVILIEYYDRVSNALVPYRNQLDTYVLLEMPKSCCYHKHVMYNVGIALAKGEIVVICDSDSMAKPTFIQSIIEAFEQDSQIVLHIDQFRNELKEYYPFNWPLFEQVLGEGARNNAGGKTLGLVATGDFIHKRNYGACFCALRKDLLAICGADEHIDYAGHICGPYEMTFRLVNAGKAVRWHEEEFLYHTWHPGTDGVANYFGPEDGLGVSSTAINLMHTGQILPHVANPLLVTMGKTGEKCSLQELKETVITSQIFRETEFEFLKSKRKVRTIAEKTYLRFCSLGVIYQRENGKIIPLVQKNLKSDLPSNIFRFIYLVLKKISILIKDRWIKRLYSSIVLSIRELIEQSAYLVKVMFKKVGKFLRWNWKTHAKIFVLETVGDLSVRGMFNFARIDRDCIVVCSQASWSTYEKIYQLTGKAFKVRWVQYPQTETEWGALVAAVRETRCLMVHRGEFIETVSRIPQETRRQSSIFSI